MATLYDHRGNKIAPTELRREHAAPSLTGLRQVWGIQSMAAGLTPDRLAYILGAANDGDAYDYLTLAEEMEERDPHYASVLATRKLAVAGLEVVVEAASDDARDVALADEVRELVAETWWTDMVFDLMDALGKGYSVCEILWDRTGSTWRPSGVEWRDPRFFVFDRETGREIRLLTEGDTNGVPLAPFKFISHVHRRKSGLLIRGGLARLAAASYMCKAFSLSDWMAFAEVFGMPLRLGRYGPQASEQDIRTLVNAVANIGTDAACVIPDSMRIEFQEAGKAAGGHELFLKLAEWLDRQISKAVLGQTMTTDDGSSQSQARVHNEVRMDLLKADAKSLAPAIERDLVRPYIDLNHGQQEHYPKVRLHVEEPEDLAGLADVLAKLVPLGNLGIEASVVRDRLGFSDPAEGAALLGTAVAQPPQTAPAANRATARNRAEPDEEDDLAALEAEELEDWEPLIGPIFNPVLGLAEQSATYEEFLSGLPDLLNGDMDSTAIVNSLAEAVFKSRGLGEGGR